MAGEDFVLKENSNDFPRECFSVESSPLIKVPKVGEPRGSSVGYTHVDNEAHKLLHNQDKVPIPL